MNLKCSDHNIFSNSTYISLNNFQVKLIYSGRSGKLVPVSLAEHKAIKNKDISTITASRLEILKKAEIIVSNDISDMEAIINRNNQAINNSDSLYFVILPTSFCNMGCGYCGQSHEKGSINQELVRKITTRISGALQSLRPKKIDIGWFGGEPLVGYAKILELSDELIKSAQETSTEYNAKMVTNGSLLTLNKLIELHERCKVTEFHITLDGPPEIHDKRRFLKKEGKSFHKITDLIQKALRDEKLNKIKYIFRTNIDKENQEYIANYLDLMHQMGFAHKQVSYDLKPVYPWSNDVTDIEIKRSEYARLEIEWMTKMLELGMDHNFLFDLTKITCTAVSPYAEVISSSGKTFSCTEHPLVPIHEMKDYVGHVDEPWEKQRNSGQFDNFNEKILKSQMPCSSCQFLGICGGACPKHWEQGYTPCPSIKYNIQGRLDIVAIKMGFQILTQESLVL